MKLLTLFLSVMPCFIFAQEQTDANKRDTIKPSSEELYNFGTVNTNSLKEGWQKFENELIDRVHYPKDWEIFENFMGTILMIKSPLSEKDDAFSENITLINQSIKQSDNLLTLEEFVKIRGKENRNYFEEFKIVEEMEDTYLNSPATVIVFTGKKNEVSFKIKQYFFVKGDFIYLYTYSAKIDVFDELEDISTDIYKSLRVSKN